ncbi:hypothetical protein IC784_04440 [Acinetobacter seifertii]|nr:hypothetical protein IC784_04440 [Acinetobacter seifertii]
MPPVEYTKENDLHIIKITGKSRLTPIVRDGEELFSATGLCCTKLFLRASSAI